MVLIRDDYKISIAVGLLLTGLTLATGIAVYSVMQRQIETSLGRGLEVALQGQARLFESKIEDGLADVHAVVTRPFLIQSLQRLNAQPGSASALYDLQRNIDSLPLAGFTAAAVYDIQGKQLIQTGSFSPETTPSLPLHSHRNASLLWGGQFILRVTGEVLDQDRRHIGSIKTEKRVPQLTRSFGEIRAIGKTGEFMLCEPLGTNGQEIGCFLSKIDRVEYRQLPRVIDGVPLPMDYALKGKSGIKITKDYRQIAVVAAHAPLGATDVGMVLKLDEDELYSQVSGQIKTIISYLVVLTIIGISLIYWLLLPLIQKLIKSEQEHAHNEALRGLVAHVEQMQEDDRKYIAREIHDELGQILAALRLEISRLGSGRETSNEKMKNIQHNATELVDEAIQGMRNVVTNLRPASLELGIVDAIQKLQTEFTKHSDTVCILQLPENPINLDEEQTIAIFRIVQESLTNVTRHAEASCVEITLIQSAGGVIVEIRDDGKGSDSLGTTKKSFGLLGMRERVATMKGKIEIISAPQQGTLVRVRIPVNRNEEASKA